jgi:hypothetical protein
LSVEATQHEWSEEEIRALVRDLESLQAGRMAAAALVGCGPRAIPHLREFLLEGRPRGIFQPRQLAAETLAELGAREVLIEYLRAAGEISDPVVRHAEYAVESTAARELARWPTEETFQALKEVASRRLLPGLVEALGTFRRPEMAHYFLNALGDDVCRAAAEEALTQLREFVRGELIEATTQPLPSAEEEVPSSKIRRRAALRILARLKLPVEDWERLKCLLADPDPEIALRAAEIALAIAGPADRGAAVERLLGVLSQGDGYLQLEAKSCLRRHYVAARAIIKGEIARRQSRPKRKQLADLVLRMLLALQAEANPAPPEAENQR